MNERSENMKKRPESSGKWSSIYEKEGKDDDIQSKNNIP